MADKDDDISDAELTPRERRNLRKLMRDEDRADWLKSAIKVWLYTLTGLAAGVVTLYTAWTTIKKAIFG